MSLVFWDTMLFIYLIEEHPRFGPRVIEIRRRMLARGDQLVTSALTLGELLAGAAAGSDLTIAGRYRCAMAAPFCDVLPFTARTAEYFGQIRGGSGILPADAIQLACAAEAKVDLFVQTTAAWRRKIPGIQFIADLDFDYL